MAEETEPVSLADHLEHLAIDVDDIVAMLTRPHSEGGDIHPEALGKSERLQASLRDVIDALKKPDHVAAGVDDVWRMLTVKHRDHTDHTIT